MAMDIEIRRAGIEELAVLIEWRMRVLSEVFAANKDADNLTIRSNNEAYYRKHLSDGTHTACFAVAQGDNQIVGCGGICYQAEMPSPDNLNGVNGYIMNVYTVPEFRGMGIGEKIVMFLINNAKQHGAGKIYLESSDAARKLYRKIGFADMKDYMKL